MGLFAMGLDLDDLPSRYGSNVSFHACYHELFEPDGLGQLLIAVNGVVPIRWLPIEANRRFVNAHKTLRSLLRAVIQERIRGLDPSKTNNTAVAGEKNAQCEKGREKEKNKDLLTWMVTERYYAAKESDRWAEDEILDQVRVFPF